jgi:hypothetical protein
MLQTQASGIGEVGGYGSNGRFGGGVSLRNRKTAENGKYGIGRPGAPMVAVVENSSGGDAGRRPDAMLEMGFQSTYRY